MIAAGVANPMAQGQATINTAEAMMKAAVKADAGTGLCQRNLPSQP
jgi:hypothetical protein